MGNFHLLYSSPFCLFQRDVNTGGAVAEGVATVGPNVPTKANVLFLVTALLTGLGYYTYTGLFIVNSLLVEGFFKSQSSVFVLITVVLQHRVFN